MNQTTDNHSFDAGGSTVELLQRTDSINGDKITLLLNAPWLTLPDDSMLVRGAEADDFAKKHNARHARMVELQWFVSPFDGSLLVPAIDSLLSTIPVDERPVESITHICVPLDTNWYLAQYDRQMNSLVEGTEQLYAEYESIQPLYEADRIMFLRGGKQSEIVDVMLHKDITITAAAVQHYSLKPLLIEFLRNRLLTRRLLIRAGAGAAVSSFLLWLVLNWLFAPQPAFIPPPPPPPGPELGVDLATPQLLWANGVISELGYFSDKYIYQATITPDGATFTGQIPPAATLHRFVGELTAANLNINFLGGGGWTVTTPGANVTPTPFELGGFNESFIALQAAAEIHGYDIETAVPLLSGDRQTTTATLTPTFPGLPDLAPLAESLRGHAFILESIVLDWGLSIIPDRVSITLTMDGLP